MTNKTLKDFEYDAEHELDDSEVKGNFIDSFLLKQEAIKWIKEWESQKGLIDEDAGEFSKKRLIALNSKIVSFTNFFNITKEDLE